MQGLLSLLVLMGSLPSAGAREHVSLAANDDAAANVCKVPHAVTAVRVRQRWFDVADGARQRRAVVSALPPAVAKRSELAGATTAVAVEKGWLVGTDRGRRGGDLRFVPPRGASIVLWTDTVRSLTVVGAKYLAVVDKPGTVDLIEVARDPKARAGWATRKLAQLPGRELVSFALSEDRLMVLTSGGSASVGLDGSIREESCPDEYLTGEAGAPEAEAVPAPAKRSLPATVSGISEAAVRDHVDDAVTVLNLVLNDPRVTPFFHLDRAGTAKPRVLQLPAVLPEKAFKVAGREIEWVKAAIVDKQASDFRFLDMDLSQAAVASVAFAHPGEGIEGYAMVAKQDGVWRVVGLHVVER